MATNHLGMYQYTHVPSNNRTQIMSVYIDKDFGEADKVEIAKALEQWNFALNGNAKFLIASQDFDMSEDSVLRDVQIGKAFLILKVNSNNPIVDAADSVVRQYKPQATGKDLSWGFTTSIGDHKVYLVRDRMNNGDIFYITMHELGHALGAEHTTDGLMYRLYSQDKFQCVDWLAIKQVAEYHGWDLGSINYCITAAPATDRAKATSN